MASAIAEYTLFKNRPASVIIIIFFEIKFQRELETLIKSISAQPSSSALHACARVEHSLVRVSPVRAGLCKSLARVPFALL